MKKIIAISLILMTILSTFAMFAPAAYASSIGRILWDSSHGEEPISDFSVFVDELTNKGYQIDELTTGPITESKLEGYDVLILVSPSISFSPSEKNAIISFVQEGHGLFQFCIYDFNARDVANPVSTNFGVTFVVDMVKDPTTNYYGRDYMPIIHQMEAHPLTDGVSQFVLEEPGTFQLSGDAQKIAWGDEDAYCNMYPAGNYPPVLVASNFGNGRTVFILDTDCLKNWLISEYNNKQLGLNIVDWLQALPHVDWDGIRERANVRRQLYELYYEKALSHSWWHDVAMDKAEAASQLWDPLASTAENLFILLLPEVLGDLAILTDAYTITAGLILLYEALLYDTVSNTLFAASQEHPIDADLSTLITKVSSVVAACEARDFQELLSSLEEERSATEDLYEGTVEYEVGIWNWLIDPTVPPVPFPWSETDIYRLLVRYPRYYPVDGQFSLAIQDGLLVGLRTSLEANYLETTLLLGSQKNLPEETVAPLTSRYVSPLVADAYWTVDNEEITEVDVGDEVVANVILTTYDLMKVNGEVTVEVWKDLRFPWPYDEQHNDYETTRSINLDVGENSDVIQLPFIAEHASNPIPGLGFQGYYLKISFTGSGISNVGSNRIEDVWVTWVDDGGNSMKNEYPPRLKARGRIFGVRAESPVNLLVIDPQGNRVGFDYISQEVVNEMTGALYNGPGTEPQMVSISEPLDGDYVVLFVGTTTGPYCLTTELILPGEIVSQTFAGETAEGAVYVYEVSITDEVMTANPDPVAELEHLNEFFDELPDDAFDQSIRRSSYLKKALSKKIYEVILKVEAGNYIDAINKLSRDIRAKMDGDSTAEDWIIDPTAQSRLCVIIDHIISSIETLQE